MLEWLRQPLECPAPAETIPGRALWIYFAVPEYVIMKSVGVTCFSVRESLISSTVSTALPSSGYPSQMNEEFVPSIQDVVRTHRGTT